MYHYDCGIIHSERTFVLCINLLASSDHYGDIELVYIGSGNDLLSVAPFTNMD